MALKILHAADSSEAADRLAEALVRERRREATILLVSAGMEAAPNIHDIVREALTAANEGTLVVVRIGDAPLPIGVRDAPSVEWSADNDPKTLRMIVRDALPKAKSKGRLSWLIGSALVLVVIVAASGSLYMSPVSSPGTAEVAAPPAAIDVVQQSADPDIRALNERLDRIEAGLDVQSEDIKSIRSDVSSTESATSSLDERTTQLLILVGVLLAWKVIVALVSLLRRPRKRRAEAESSASGETVVASYSRQDGQRVDQLITDLKQQGVTVWIDRTDIDAGSTWSASIVRAIRTSRGLLLFCSAKAFQSDHVLRELNLADSCRKPIYPVMLEPVEVPDAFLYYLSTRQMIDLTGDPNWQKKLSQVLQPNVRRLDD